jgi:hypothetical protein
MTEQHDDYLWDPGTTPHPEIQSLERQLKPLSASALRLAHRPLPLPRESARPTQWKRYLRVAVAAAATLTGVYLGHLYRLSWPEGSPWPTSIVHEDGSTRSTVLRVGERIATTPLETATLEAARIGKVHIAPNSKVQLTRTRIGQHRIELVQGRLHAKIWAPPNHFGVAHRGMNFIDLGCEFDLNVGRAGSGTLVVTSGWVIYGHGDEEILVPERYSLTFDGRSAQVPVRIDSSSDFRGWVNELDALFTSADTGDQSRISTLSQVIAADARDEDYFTLLSLLVRHPSLAQGPLYPRLATALNIGSPDESHRARWASGDPNAREEWWQRLPKQPKTWWLNWRDAL